MLVWPAKDPDEVADYAIDWEPRLGTDTISTAAFSFTEDAGMAIDDSSHDSAFVSIVTLSGGTEGERGKVLCEITTAGGQTLQQTATLILRAR